MKLQIEYRPLTALIPYIRNARVHSDTQIAQIAGSIREFGFNNPVLVDGENGIIAGHGRVLAARKLGLETVPVVELAHLSEPQKRAYILADNRLAELASWDPAMLQVEIEELRALNFDVDLTGFSTEALDELLASFQEPVIEPTEEEDIIPEPPDEAVTRPGDVWILGQHRLMCGDSSSPEDLDRLLAGAKIHLVNTDPPYNVKVEPRSNNAIAAGLSSFAPAGAHHQSFDLERHPEKAVATHAKLRPKDRPLANDFVSDEEFDRLLLAWFGNIARVLLAGRAFYIWGGYANCANYPHALKESDLYFSQAVIWVKGHPVLTRKDFMGNHEWCFYGWRMGAAHVYLGPNNATDVWEVKKINPQSMVHLTEKPVALATMAIQYSSRPGENVLDLFGGSGSTLIGCERAKRKAFLMEIDPLYCDVIVKRWADFTGGDPIREGDGCHYFDLVPPQNGA